MGLDSSVGLVVAALDLKLVRLVRAAMQPGNGGAPGPMRLIQPQPGAGPRRRAEPEPVVEPRPRVRPEPAVEPRQTLGMGVPRSDRCDGCGPVVPTEPAEKSPNSSSPVEPPWKVLPWEDRPPPAPVRYVPVIKVIQARPDIQCKGSVIDLFI